MALGIPSSNILGSGGKVEYLLTLEEPASISKRKTIALPFVNMFRHDSKPAVQIRHTLGRSPIIEHSGTKKLIFTLQGRSGQHYYLGSDSSGNLKFASGVDLFQDLIRFLQRYEEITSSRIFKRTGQGLNEGEGSGLEGTKPFSKGHLVFLAPFENLSYHVVPTAFSVNRSVQTSRHDYEFTLTLEATSEYIAATTPLSAFEKVLQGAESITEAIDTAAGAVAYAQAHVEIFQGDLRRLLSPIDAIQRLVTELDDLGSSGKSTLNIVSTQTNRLLSAIGQASRVAYDAINLLSFNALQKATDQGFNEFMSELAKARNQITTVFGKGFLAYEEQDGEPSGQAADVVTVNLATTAAALVAQSNDPIVDESSESFSYAKLLDGETLLQFCKRLGLKAQEVAKLNGMVNFLIGEFSVPLTGGMLMKVPIDNPIKVKPGDADIFGTDLQIDLSTGDLVLSGTDPKDFFSISGPPNLKQGTTLRLLTVEGENSVFPNLGMPLHFGDASTSELVGSVAFDARSQLLADSRINEVTSLFLRDAGDTLSLEIEARAKKDTDIQFSVPIS